MPLSVSILEPFAMSDVPGKYIVVREPGLLNVPLPLLLQINVPQLDAVPDNCTAPLTAHISISAPALTTGVEEIISVRLSITGLEQGLIG